MTRRDGAMDIDSPWAFFALVFALSVPFWVIGAITGLVLPLNLPAGALMAANPLIAAALLIWRRHGFAGVKALLRTNRPHISSYITISKSEDTKITRPPISWRILQPCLQMVSPFLSVWLPSLPIHVSASLRLR